MIFTLTQFIKGNTDGFNFNNLHQVKNNFYIILNYIIHLNGKNTPRFKTNPKIMVGIGYIYGKLSLY